MLNDKLIPIRVEVYGRGGHQLRIQGVELIRVLVRPQGEPGGTADQIKRLLEGGDHVHPGKPVHPSFKPGGGRLLDNLESLIFFHGAIIGKKTPHAITWWGKGPLQMAWSNVLSIRHGLQNLESILGVLLHISYILKFRKSGSGGGLKPSHFNGGCYPPGSDHVVFWLQGLPLGTNP